jgi:hypothetical protein
VREVHVPWKVSDPVSERLEFVQRWLGGERVSDLCREFGISRKTAYKMRARFEEHGARGLFDVSRARKTQGRRTPLEVERAVLSVREKHPTWGARKIVAWLRDRSPGLHLPSASTIELMFVRNNVVRRRMRRQTYEVHGARLRTAAGPNDVSALRRFPHAEPSRPPSFLALPLRPPIPTRPALGTGRTIQPIMRR